MSFLRPAGTVVATIHSRAAIELPGDDVVSDEVARHWRFLATGFCVGEVLEAASVALDELR